MTYSGLIIGGPLAGQSTEQQIPEFSIYTNKVFSRNYDLVCDPFVVTDSPEKHQYVWHMLSEKTSVWSPAGWTREQIIVELCDAYWKYKDLSY